MATPIRLFRTSRGDDGFEPLVAPHLERLYRLAYRFTGNRSDAEDLVQDLLIQLYPRRNELTGVERLGPWLARALYYRFVDTLRHGTRDPLRSAVDEEILQDTADPRTSPEQDAENALLHRRLAQALAELNPDQRALVALHDMEGYTLEELQDMLDTPLGTLKSRLHRARRHLRAALATEPFVDELRVNKQRSRQ